MIEGVTPQVDCGLFAIKRTAGDDVTVEADVFGDGHDYVSGALLYKKEGQDHWTEALLEPLGNDRWRGFFPVTEIGRYWYTLEGWVDHFLTWYKDMGKRVQANRTELADYLIGALLAEQASKRANGREAQRLADWARQLRDNPGPDVALDTEMANIALRYPDRSLSTRYERELPVWVDRERARFSSWYEFFPRSASPDPQRHGTFRDCEERLEYVASMGFDVVYFPPVHPIGMTFRKGKNNSPVANKGDSGSPWAIGAHDGGHKAIHSQLGTFDDFTRLVSKARSLNMEVALDIAYQCTPDHPYVREHSDWFKRRPDGTIQYAENPPKKYQDIYPMDFESADWRAMWRELRDVVQFWIDRDVKIFRVDNPHTKAFGFWGWMIADIRERHPDVIFLSEAFTRPKVMYRLAKLGFTQSYTYFTWRNNKHELTEYFTELTQSAVKEFFRPNLWPNTPDILHACLQTGGRPAFQARFVLAATLGANYGIYGPAFELCENTPREPGSEEYLNSEKYEVRNWNLHAEWSLRELITTVNHARRQNPALQRDEGLRFHGTDNPDLICYSKRTPDGSNTMLMLVNLDPKYTQSGWTDLDLWALGLGPDDRFWIHDVLDGSRYEWHGRRNYIELNPMKMPAHVFVVART